MPADSAIVRSTRSEWLNRDQLENPSPGHFSRSDVDVFLRRTLFFPLPPSLSSLFVFLACFLFSSFSLLFR